MFGGLAFLTNGNVSVMCVAASGQGGLMVRVRPDDTEKLLKREHVSVKVMAGREPRGCNRACCLTTRMRPLRLNPGSIARGSWGSEVCGRAMRCRNQTELEAFAAARVSRARRLAVIAAARDGGPVFAVASAPL
jgi:hypothetical protein